MRRKLEESIVTLATAHGRAGEAYRVLSRTMAVFTVNRSWRSIY
jgi:hypothetical protein